MVAGFGLFLLILDTVTPGLFLELSTRGTTMLPDRTVPFPTAQDLDLILMMDDFRRGVGTWAV
jgi:hypothetical protein